jgi:FkbM family methyltransferase
MEATAEAYGLTFRFPALDTTVGAFLRDRGEFARPELDFITECCTGTLIDVGANIGAICLPFARARPSSAVIAIEAQPAIAELLKRNATANHLPNVTVLQAVAGETAGSVDIPVAPLDTPSNVGAASLYAKGLQTAPARMIRLDDLRVDDISFVKVDVEGFEPRVLQGAQRLLSDVRPRWLVEVSRARPKTTAKVHASLTAAGYNLYWFFSPFVTRAPEGEIRGDMALFASDEPPPWDLTPASEEWPSDVGALPYLKRYGLVASSR